MGQRSADERTRTCTARELDAFRHDGWFVVDDLVAMLANYDQR